MNYTFADMLAEIEVAESELREVEEVLATLRSSVLKLINDELKNGKNTSVLPSCD